MIFTDKGAYEMAILNAWRDTNLSDSLFPEGCPWSVGAVAAEDFWPES